MKKKILTILSILTLSLASSLTVFASPETMPDGGVFDAEYYAQNNPDVVQAFGTDKNLLYSHYVNCGKTEGRLPYAPVELTKVNPVTETPKRKYLRTVVDPELYDYFNTIVDKAGYEFRIPGIDLYFSDADIERFNSYEELLEFAKTIDIYEYADKVTFRNYYYYQDLKAKATEYALAHVNEPYCEFHYHTGNYKYSEEEVVPCLVHLEELMRPYYGANTDAKARSGLHWVETRDEYHVFGGKTRGYCMRIGIYRSEDDSMKYFNKWADTICPKVG